MAAAEELVWAADILVVEAAKSATRSKGQVLHRFIADYGLQCGKVGHIARNCTEGYGGGGGGGYGGGGYGGGGGGYGGGLGRGGGGGRFPSSLEGASLYWSPIYASLSLIQFYFRSNLLLLRRLWPHVPGLYPRPKMLQLYVKSNIGASFMDD